MNDKERKEYMKLYRARNREKLISYSRAYWSAHGAEVNARRRKPKWESAK